MPSGRVLALVHMVVECSGSAGLCSSRTRSAHVITPPPGPWELSACLLPVPPATPVFVGGWWEGSPMGVEALHAELDRLAAADLSGDQAVLGGERAGVVSGGDGGGRR